MLRPVFHNLRDKIDDSGYGGAPLLGVNGLCIKCHGSSKARSIEQALYRQVYPFVSNNVINQLRDTMESLEGKINGGQDDQ